jgi:hypothetical protein
MFSLALAGFGKHGDGAFQRVLGWQAGLFALALLAYIAMASRGGRMWKVGPETITRQ